MVTCLLRYLNIKTFSNDIKNIIKTFLHMDSYNFPTISGYPTVGLFNGLAGIGYMFLRYHAYPDDIPDPLTLSI